MARYHLHLLESRLVALEGDHASVLRCLICTLRVDDLVSRVGCVAGASATASVG